MYLGRNRRPNRLRDYDYSQNGYYFVTICTKNKQEFFGQVENGEMILNDDGEIVKKCWADIADRFPDVELDEFIVMPNHIHGILIIENDDDIARVGNRRACSLPLQPSSPLPQLQKRQYQKLPVVIGSFKSTVSKNIHIQNDFYYFQW